MTIVKDGRTYDTLENFRWPFLVAGPDDGKPIPDANVWDKKEIVVGEETYVRRRWASAGAPARIFVFVAKELPKDRYWPAEVHRRIYNSHQHLEKMGTILIDTKTKSTKVLDLDLHRDAEKFGPTGRGIAGRESDEPPAPARSRRVPGGEKDDQTEGVAMPKKVPAKEVSTAQMMEMVVSYVGEQDGGGSFAMVRRAVREGADLEWSLAAQFGKEAEDSPMAGGAAYGLDADLRTALEQVASDCGLIEREPEGAKDDGGPVSSAPPAASGEWPPITVERRQGKTPRAIVRGEAPAVPRTGLEYHRYVPETERDQG